MTGARLTLSPGEDICSETDDDQSGSAAQGTADGETSISGTTIYLPYRPRRR